MSDKIKSKKKSLKKLKLQLVIGFGFIIFMIIIISIAVLLVTLDVPKASTLEQYEEGTLIDVQIMDDLTLVVFDNTNYLILETSHRYSSTQTHVTAYAELFRLKGEWVKIFYLSTEYGNYYQDVTWGD